MSDPEGRGAARAAQSPALARTRAEFAAARAGLGGPVVLVPTMGALHAGHERLLRAARTLAGPRGSVIVSIFVNPLQFGPNEDLNRYPRTLDEDLAICAREGAQLVFAPSAAEMYPGGKPEVTVDPGPAGQLFEGEFRPGFFVGVLTVVLKLLHLAQPAIAVFGQKDAQQLALVRRMVTDLNLDVVIEPVPTVRDADGLATSSRNRYLSAADRAVALTLPRALRARPGQGRREFRGRGRGARRCPGCHARRTCPGRRLRRGGRPGHVRPARDPSTRGCPAGGGGPGGRHAADRQYACRAGGGGRRRSP